VDVRSLPLYLYKTVDGFVETMEQYVRTTLQEGLFGWRVTDCTVTMTECGTSSETGQRGLAQCLGRSPRQQLAHYAADFRKLTPLVLMRALERAQTVVCEPMVRAHIEIPTDSIGAVWRPWHGSGGRGNAVVGGELSVTETVLPASRAQDLRRQLSGLHGGEGVVKPASALPAGDRLGTEATTDDGEPSQP